MDTRYDQLPPVGSKVIIVPESIYRLYGVVADVAVDDDDPNVVTIRMTLQTVPDDEPYLD